MRLLIMQGFGYINPSLLILQKYLRYLWYKKYLEDTIEELNDIIQTFIKKKGENYAINVINLYNKLKNEKRYQEEYFQQTKELLIVDTLETLCGLQERKKSTTKRDFAHINYRDGPKIIVTTCIRDNLDEIDVVKGFPLHYQTSDGYLRTDKVLYEIKVKILKLINSDSNKDTTNESYGEKKIGGLDLNILNFYYTIFVFLILLIIVLVIVILYINIFGKEGCFRNW